MSAPGLIHETMRWAEDSLKRPNRPLVFGAALSVLGFLATDRFRADGIRPNLNVLIVAPSPAGKTTALQWAYDLFGLCERRQHPYSGFASRVAFDQTVADGRAFLWEREHADMSWPKARADQYLAHFLSDGSIGNMIATRVPGFFDQDVRRNKSFRQFAETALVVANGFGDGPMSPCLLGPTPTIPASLVRILEWWTRPAGAPVEVPVTDEAEWLFEDATDVWLNALKLAILYAASGDPEKPVIDRAAAEWGIAVARHCAWRAPNPQ